MPSAEMRPMHGHTHLKNYVADFTQVAISKCIYPYHETFFVFAGVFGCLRVCPIECHNLAKNKRNALWLQEYHPLQREATIKNS